MILLSQKSLWFIQCPICNICNIYNIHWNFCHKNTMVYITVVCKNIVTLLGKVVNISVYLAVRYTCIEYDFINRYSYNSYCYLLSFPNSIYSCKIYCNIKKKKTINIQNSDPQLLDITKQYKAMIVWLSLRSVPWVCWDCMKGSLEWVTSGSVCLTFSTHWKMKACRNGVM